MKSSRNTHTIIRGDNKIKMKLQKVFTKRIQSLKEDPPTEECSKSVQSFRDIIPSDNRLDLNSATEKQLHTLPGLNKVSFFIMLITVQIT